MSKQRRPIVLHVLPVALLAVCLVLGQGLLCGMAFAEQNANDLELDAIELIDESKDADTDADEDSAIVCIESDDDLVVLDKSDGSDALQRP